MLELLLYVSVVVSVLYLLIMALVMIFLYIALKRAMSEAAGGEVVLSLGSVASAIFMCHDVFTEMVQEDILYALFYTPLFIIASPSLALKSFQEPFQVMLKKGDITFDGGFED